MKVELSIIVLSYNTKDLLRDCLESLVKLRDEVAFEIIVVDNGSTDGSATMIERRFPQVKLIKNSENVGFAKGNNSARKFCEGKYILFLNSDTIISEGVLSKALQFIKADSKIGALTCKLLMPNGKLDLDARRSFPTPWVAFTHFGHLDRIFPKSNLFSKYWYGYISPDVTHEIDVIQGAFFLTKKSILDDVDWFDEDYFLDGEDIDLSWKIKQKGWKAVYYPEVSILHIKGASKGKNKNIKSKPSFTKRAKFVLAGVNSMEIFYKKHLYKRYPFILNALVFIGIYILKFIRIIRILLT